MPSSPHPRPRYPAPTAPASSLRHPALAGVVAVLALLMAACTDDAPAGNADGGQTTVPDDTATGPGDDGDGGGDTGGSVVTADRIGYAETRCEFDLPADVTVTCGWLTVPQHWDDPDDPDTLELHVATFEVDDTPVDAVPLVYLEGGPGGDALGLVQFSFDILWGDIVAERPVVLFSQRGSALSTVDLECEELTEFGIENLATDPDEDLSDAELEVTTTCIERLRTEGADFSAYHTVASAHDVEAVRLALGHDTWHVVGISYGTRLGQEVARLHPDGLESLVLDSVQPTAPAQGSLAAVPTTFQRALQHLFEGCAASDVCAATFPDLENRYWAVVDAAEAIPLELQVQHPLEGDTYDAVIDGDALVELTFGALYSRDAFAALPQMVADLEQGNTRVPSALLGQNLVNSEAFSVGQYSAVMCHDYLVDLTPTEAFTAGRSGDDRIDDRMAASIEEVTQVCPLLDAGSADADVTEPVTSDVPSLLLAGEYDPITPPSFAEAVLPGFSKGELVVVPHVGHGVVGDECGNDLLRRFLAEPLEPLDTACVGQVTEPPWVPPSLTEVELVPFEDRALGTTGVVPADWLEVGIGAYSRQDTNIARPLILVQQAIPAAPDGLAQLMGLQLGTEFQEAGTIEAGGRTWTRNEATLADGTTIDLHVAPGDDEGTSLSLITQAASEDLAPLRTELVPALLAELQAG
ncbi:MAG: alpha/beta fold hydrolase [Acidimicrobiales bacterium]